MKTGRKQAIEATADDTEITSKVEEPAAGSKRASESADGASQLQEFSHAEAGDDHAPAEGTGEEYGYIVDGKEELPDEMPMTPSGSELGEQDDEDDDDSDRRNKSIGKKLWSFFTT